MYRNGVYMVIIDLYDDFVDENEYAFERSPESRHLLKAGVRTIAEDPLREAAPNLAHGRKQ